MAAEEPAAAATTWPRSSDSSASVPARHSSSNSQLASCLAQLASLASAQPAAAAGALGGYSSLPQPAAAATAAPRRWHAPCGALAPFKGAEARGPPAAPSPNLQNKLSGAKEHGQEEETGNIGMVRALTSLQALEAYILVYALALSIYPWILI